MSAVDVYLDVDGVLNAVTRTEPDWGWGRSEVVTVNGYPIRYSPVMVERFNALAARPDVCVNWLTTWRSDAPRLLAPAIGLRGEDWPVITEPPVNGWGWWKLPAAREHFMGNGNRAVWIDDDLFDSSAREWAAPFVADGLLMLVQPLSQRGLTLTEFDAIETWVESSERAA